jgi:hypothetical protein
VSSCPWPLIWPLDALRVHGVAAIHRSARRGAPPSRSGAATCHSAATAAALLPRLQ